ncbi:MAG: tetratricopeptide repeat protein [Acidobacteria bacterium]|nr:tetratricopeptide repeat protein [Acidobacteriota bacterium]
MKRFTIKIISGALFACFCLPMFVAAQKPQRKPTVSRKSSPALEQLSQRAAAARDNNQLEEAIALYRQGLKANPTWAEGWWYLGTLLYELERHGEARDALRRMATLNPNGGPTWSLIGLCEFQLREYQQALLHLTRARTLGLGGNEQMAYVNNYHAALLLTRFEQYEAGLELLNILLRQQNANPALVEALGLNLMRAPYLPAELPPDKRERMLRLGKAGALAIGNKLEDTRREFNDLIKDYPQTANLHYALGIFLLPSLPDDALAEFRRELELSPRHVPAQLQLAFEYLKRNEYAQGLPFAEQAVQLDANSFPARNVLGRLLLELDQTERAIKELEAGTKLAPDSPEMHFALARAYSKVGRKTEATKARTEFMRLDKMRRSQRESQFGPAAPETPKP